MTRNVNSGYAAVAKYRRNILKNDEVNFRAVASADLGGAIGGVINWGVFGKAAYHGLVFGPGGAVMTIASEAVRGAIIGSAVFVASCYI